MIEDLLLHDSTRTTIEQLLQRHVHAVLFVGQQGAGKQTLLRSVAATVLGTTGDKLSNEPRYLEVAPSDKSSVTIEQIRELQHFLTLKTTGKDAIRRVIVILQADTMGSDAQNALLKTVEEPPLDTMIFLGASQTEDLLPTIRSRVQLVHIAQPDIAVAENYFVAKSFNQAEIRKVFALSGGQVGLMTSILSGESGELTGMVDLAKALLAKSAFERLAQVDEISKQKETIGGLLLALKRICTAALEQSAAGDRTTAVKAWHGRLQLVLDAEAAYRKSANAKLLLTDLFLSL
jgi:DNA polymerase-3 subunit delta'